MFINLVAFDYLYSHPMLNYQDSFKDYFTWFRHNLDILANQVVDWVVNLEVNQVDNLEVNFEDSLVANFKDNLVINWVDNLEVNLVDNLVVNLVDNWELNLEDNLVANLEDSWELNLEDNQELDLVDKLEVDRVDILVKDLVNSLIINQEGSQADNLTGDSFIIDSMDILLFLRTLFKNRVVAMDIIMIRVDNWEVVNKALINYKVIGNKELQEVSLVLHYFIDNIEDLKVFKAIVNILNQKTIQKKCKSIQPIFPEFLMII